MGQKCHAHTTSGEPCGAWALTGSKVCFHHGGATKVAKSRAIVRKELNAWGLDDIEDDPALVLLRLITQSRRRADLYSSLLQEAYEAAEKAGVDKALDSNWHLPAGVQALIGQKYTVDKDGVEHPVEEAIRGLTALEAAERDRCANFATKAIAAGIAERQVRVQEQQAALAHAALLAGLDAAGITGDTRRLVLEGAVARLSLEA